MSTPENQSPDGDDLYPEVQALLRLGPIDLPTERPSEAVWDAIADAAPDLVAGSGSGPGAPSVVATPPDTEPGTAPVQSLFAKPARPWVKPLVMVTAAAAALLVAVPLLLAVTSSDDRERRQAELAALADFDGSGSAELDGRSLTVDFAAEPAPDGSFYELWLLQIDDDEGLVGLQSLGPIEVGEDGSFEVPEGVDLDEFATVDVSIEPDDGNPDHSGQSVLQGQLQES